MAIHFIAEVIGKRKNDDRDNTGGSNETVEHPAEFDLR
jgi:hypothetical protein